MVLYMYCDINTYVIKLRMLLKSSVHLYTSRRCNTENSVYVYPLYTYRVKLSEPGLAPTGNIQKISDLPHLMYYIYVYTPRTA